MFAHNKLAGEAWRGWGLGLVIFNGPCVELITEAPLMSDAKNRDYSVLTERALFLYIIAGQSHEVYCPKLAKSTIEPLGIFYN